MFGQRFIPHLGRNAEGGSDRVDFLGKIEQARTRLGETRIDQHHSAGSMRQQRRRVFWYGRCGGDPERGALDFLKGGLRQRIIKAQRADAAIFQFDPHRTLRIDGIDIEHGARIPYLARLVDPLVRAIADGDQLFAQIG